MQARVWAPVLALLYAAGFWGLVWHPLRLLADAGLTGVWQTFVSYVAALMFALPFLRRKESWSRHWGQLLLLALATGWCNLAFVLAMLEGTVLRVLLLFYLSPVWAVIFGRWLLREPVSPRAWLLLGVAMAGAVLILWPPGLGRSWPVNAADWLALSSGIAFALSNVSVRRLREMSLAAKIITAWTGAVLVAGAGIMVTSPTLPEAVPAAWGGAVLVGVPGIFLATLALQYGVTHLAIQRSSVILLFEVVVGAVSAAWLAGEMLAWREFLGGMLILSAGYAMAAGSADSFVMRGRRRDV